MTTTPAAEAVMGHNANAANIEAMVKEDPKIVFRDPGVLPALVEAVRARISAHPYDLTSAKGRSLITKLKSSVTSIKTLLDDTGKGLNEDHRKAINEVDGVRREVRDKLDGLADLAREPLTEWETAEEKREGQRRDQRELYVSANNIPATATLAQIAAARAKVEATTVDPALFEELTEKVTAERDQALQALDAAKARIEQDERDRAELARLRQAEAARVAAEEAAERKRQADEAAAKERERIEAEAIQRERDRIAAEAAAAQRAADEARAAEQRQRDAAEAELRRKAQEAVDAANERARLADEARERQAEEANKAEAERKRLAFEEAQRIADEEEAAEARRRDQAHREAVIERACADIMNVAGLSKPKAMVIVQAIAAGSVSAVNIEF